MIKIIETLNKKQLRKLLKILKILQNAKGMGTSNLKSVAVRTKNNLRHPSVPTNV